MLQLAWLLSIIINTKGDLSVTSPELSKLIQFIESGTPTSDDALTVRLADAVDEINLNEREWVDEMCDMETTYRIYAEEALEKGIAEGKAKGRAETLEEIKQLLASGIDVNEALETLAQ